MTDRKKTVVGGAVLTALALLLAACTATTPEADPQPAPSPTPRILTGSVAPLAAGIDPSEWTVTAWNTSPDGARDLGNTVSDGTGAFTLSVNQTDVKGVVWVDARRKQDSRALLGAIAEPGATTLTLNERTTVAAGYGLAQFFGEAVPTGPVNWLENAATMAANVADPATGVVGDVLASAPNGDQTSTLATFTSLTAMLTACLQNATSCETMFGAAAHDRDRLASAAAAFAGIARDPSAAVHRLFQVSLRARAAAPGLPVAPAAWTLPLRFDGTAAGLTAPGEITIGPDGHVWVASASASDVASATCADGRVFEIGPDGSILGSVAGSGASGFGLEFDRTGGLWLSNAGTPGVAAGAGCGGTAQPSADSVSLFDGRSALSPATGYTQGALNAPQGLTIDGDQNVWIANCGDGTLTVYPKGDPKKAKNVTGLGVQSPFGIVDNGRSLFVTANAGSTVAVFGRDGTPLAGSPLLDGFAHPTGIAADKDGNVWVANAGVPAPACGDGTTTGSGTPSVTHISPDAQTVSKPVTGGGVTQPWGIATDGDGNVWVANRTGERVSEFCGVDTTRCPRSLTTGEPISPDATGYDFVGLGGSTGIAIDLSGNVWVSSTRVLNADGTESAGHQMVAFVGAAAPRFVAPFE